MLFVELEVERRQQRRVIFKQAWTVVDSGPCKVSGDYVRSSSGGKWNTFVKDTHCSGSQGEVRR